MIKLYIKLFRTIIIIVLLCTIYIGFTYKFPNLNFFKSKSIELKDTALIIEESKKISELFSTKYYSEIIIDSTKKVVEKKTDITRSILNLANVKYTDSITSKIVIIAKGNCYAGNNLESIQSSYNTNTETLEIIIDKSKIFNTITNPSDFKIYFDDGHWNDSEVKLLKSKAKKQIIKLAYENDILDKANMRTENLLTSFLKSAGYKNVIIKFRD